MRAVFVTGGSGFLGSALLDALWERGEDVRALARSPAAAATVAARGAVPIRGDLTDLDALTAGMRGAEVVVHAAARLCGGWAALDLLRRVNVDGTRTVLQAARSAGVPRLVLISTEQVVLGDRPLVSADESAPYPDRYVGAYATTKAEAERLVLAASTAGAGHRRGPAAAGLGARRHRPAAPAGRRGAVRSAALGRRRRPPDLDHARA